jgi:hypothetical protein
MKKIKLYYVTQLSYSEPLFVSRFKYKCREYIKTIEVNPDDNPFDYYEIQTIKES